MSGASSAGVTMAAMKAVTSAPLSARPVQTLADLTERTLQRVGYGAAKAPATAVQVNVNGGSVALPPTVTQSQLADARAAIRQVENGFVAEPRLLEGPDGPGASHSDPRTKSGLITDRQGSQESSSSEQGESGESLPPRDPLEELV